MTKPYFDDGKGHVIYHGDCRTVLPTLELESVNCCVTSPPYFGLRDYGCDGQIGLEETPESFVAEMVAVFREVRRVLRDDGTLWLNLGDSYSGSGKATGRNGLQDAELSRKQSSNAGSLVAKATRLEGLKPKNLIGIPWRVAFALQADGWYLRQDIIWHKPNPMPESVLDRCTKAHEYIFLFSKSERYYFDAKAIQEESVTQDTRRPYTSTGAWEMDGRPEAQRHGGEQRKSWNGSEFHTGKTGEHQLNRASTKRGKRDGKDDLASASSRMGRYPGWRNDPQPEQRNKRSVWTVPSAPYPGSHFATFPPELIKPCILAGCPKGGTVLDPFGGSGTTGEVARDAGCNAILIELNEGYIPLIEKRLEQNVLEFA